MSQKSLPEWLKKIIENMDKAEGRLSNISGLEGANMGAGAWLLEAIGTFRGAHNAWAGLKTSEESSQRRIMEGFRAGTDIGDLLRIADRDTPEQDWKDALKRFSRGGRPIHRERRKGFPEIDEAIRGRRGIDDTSEQPHKSEAKVREEISMPAYFLSAQIFSEGWDGRRPQKKEIDISGGSKVTIRELPPIRIREFLAGDQQTSRAEWIYRLLREGIVSFGSYKAKTPDEVENLLAEAYLSPSEIASLLKAIRGFMVECLEHRFLIIRKTRAGAGREATADVLGRYDYHNIRREESLDSITGEEDKRHAKEDRLFAELKAARDLERLLIDVKASRLEREVVAELLKGKDQKQAASSLGITHAAARKRWNRLIERILSRRESLRKKYFSH